MGKAYIWLSIPPVLGMLVLVLVWSAGSVNVPSEQEIERAPLRMPPGGGIERPDMGRIAEVFRNLGHEQGSEVSEGTEEPEKPAPAAKGPFRNELVKQRNAALVHNRQARVNGLIVGGIVASLGYGVVGIALYSRIGRTPRKSWRDAVGEHPRTTAPAAGPVETQELESSEAEPQPPDRKKES